MRHPRRSAGCFVALLLAPALLADAGQAASAPAQTALPAETCRGYFIVAVEVGSRPGLTLDMLLDTGASRTFIDPAAMRQVLGPGARAGRVSFRGLRAGGHRLAPQTANVYPMATLGRAVGRPFDGILGFPAFRELLLTLDYPASEVRLSRGRLPPVDGRRIFRYSGSKRPHLEVRVDGRRRTILLDSGATSGFRLRESDVRKWAVAPRVTKAAVAFSNVLLLRAGRMDGTLQLGPLAFRHPVVTLAPGERFIGRGALRHFVITFDQGRKRVLLEPAVAGPVRMPPVVGTGLATRPRAEGLEVVHVAAGSPAAAAGLRQGDLITGIDGVPVHRRPCAAGDGLSPGRRQTFSYLRAGAAREAVVTSEILVR